MAIPAAFIQELLARADVVEIVGRYVPLRKSGANFMGLCPFHSEKSPSFSVSPTKQFYHCFGCGKSGDSIRFLMEHGGMSFREAVEDLSGQYGMQIPEDDASPADRERMVQQRAKQQTLSDVLEKAGEAYRKHLKNSPKAIAYLKGRGLSGEIAKRFGLGYAPEGWRSLASVFPEYDDPLLEESGLVIVNQDEDKRYDRFRDRIMFPIRSVKGECIGFGGRVLGDEKPKYLNSPETPVFSKGRELYGLFEARQALRDEGYVLVTEGYMDVVALAQLGFPNAVATLGTACTADHVQKLFRFTESVVFSFDGDEAGRRAARKALEGALPYATDTRSVKFLFLPSEHDPDSYIREFGRDAFSRYVHEATPLSTFLLEASAEGCNLATAEGRSKMLSLAKPLWMQLPDGALRRQLLAELATRADLQTGDVLSLWGLGAKSAGPERRQKARAARPYGSGQRKVIKPKMVALAETVARLVLRNSHAWHLLSATDHQMLCELQAPLGDLFSWIDTSFHEHGGQPWAALRVGIEGQPFTELATRLMDFDAMQPLSSGSEEPGKARPEEPSDPDRDLRVTILGLYLDAVAEEIDAADKLPRSDPERLGKLLDLSKRQKELFDRKKALLP